jgi:hypothetical protein
MLILILVNLKFDVSPLQIPEITGEGQSQKEKKFRKLWHWSYWAISFNTCRHTPLLSRSPLGYKQFGTPLDAIFGSYPLGYLSNPFRISFSPLGYH